ncbi:flavin reductase family protein [Chloroflexota bacterium]
MKIKTANLDRGALYQLMSKTVAPTPVGFISTVGRDGVYNAAAFTFMGMVGLKPPILYVSISVFGRASGERQGQQKDTRRNIEFAHDFVVNVVDGSLIEPAARASADYPSEVDEIKEVGLTAIPGEMVKSPRIAEAKVSMECRLRHVAELVEEQALRSVIFGEVVLVHIKDEVLTDGQLDPHLLKPVGRLGHEIYCHTGDIFEIKSEG